MCLISSSSSSKLVYNFKALMLIKIYLTSDAKLAKTQLNYRYFLVR